MPHPPDTIQFEDTPRHLPANIISYDPHYSPPYLAKVDLSNTYMCIWIRSKEILLFEFIVQPQPYNLKPLIRFHLYLVIVICVFSEAVLLHIRYCHQYSEQHLGLHPLGTYSHPHRP